MEVKREELHREMLMNIRENRLRQAVYSHLPITVVIEVMKEHIDCVHCPVFDFEHSCGDCKARLEEYLELKEIQYEPETESKEAETAERETKAYSQQ